ncbi:MAG TPA: fatty acid desaturase [Anaerolineae bacterium]|nr:fatty acid desaturase [Anaerolineae bacterium]
MSVKSEAKPEWYKALARYEQPDLKKSVWQLTHTLLLYFATVYLMVRTVQAGFTYWLTLALAVLAAGFLVRLFIFFHDCTHRSFFASDRANTIVGYILGVLTFTPYEEWRHSHIVHHATAGNLDRRGVGDVWTMTVDEYRAASKGKRLAYRLVRNPLVMFGLGPGFMFLVMHRLVKKDARMQERVSVIITNLALLTIIIVASLTIGFKTYFLVQFPIIIIAATLGLWLFYVQHQFADVYWARNDAWDRIEAALKGCSYYKLPAALRWFSGDIGLHHIHHLRARIPNYNLQRCYDEVPEVRAITPLTIPSSLKSLGYNLWDEERRKMVSFRQAVALTSVP